MSSTSRASAGPDVLLSHISGTPNAVVLQCYPVPLHHDPVPLHRDLIRAVGGQIQDVDGTAQRPLEAHPCPAAASAYSSSLGCQQAG
jgi:hypothetical protein